MGEGKFTGCETVREYSPRRVDLGPHQLSTSSLTESREKRPQLQSIQEADWKNTQEWNQTDHTAMDTSLHTLRPIAPSLQTTQSHIAEEREKRKSI